MQLTRHTDYAVRTLMYLAQLEEDERVRIQQVCDYFDLSINHVSKIVNQLANLGYIDSQRGRNGGIRLGMPAADIAMGEIVRFIEPTLVPVNCDEPHCALLPDCRFKSVLGEASAAFIATIDRYTLEDLVDTQRKVVKVRRN